MESLQKEKAAEYKSANILRFINFNSVPQTMITWYYVTVNYFLRAIKKKDGVKISFLPPSQRSIAVALRSALTLTVPFGAIPKNSRVVTSVCVQIRPR
jgi:hypothetical protein